MKIAVATQKGGLDDSVAPNFGRAPTLTVVEVESTGITGHVVIGNPHSLIASGAGTLVAQLVASTGATAILAGVFGPKASAVLAEAGVAAIATSGLVRTRVLEVAVPETHRTASLPGVGEPAPGWGGDRGGGRFGRGA